MKGYVGGQYHVGGGGGVEGETEMKRVGLRTMSLIVWTAL